MKRYLYDVITGRRDGFVPRLIIASLTPLAWLFGAAARLRRAAYKRCASLSKGLPVPIVCVGSIAAGGTGKTPTVIALAEMFAEAGVRPAIICSGYGGRRRGATIVSDGKRLMAGVEEVGDEAIMVGRKLLKKGIPVLAGRERFEVGRLALRLFKPDVIILDDGFQHLKLRRDVDLVVLDAESPLGTGKLLPAGTLREPPSALEEASMILLMGEGETKVKVSIPIFRARIEPSWLRPIGETRFLPLEALRGKRVLGLCSIGNPRSFKRTLLSLGIASLEAIEFPDHHLYSKDDLDLIRRRMRGFDLLITTEKDEPKLERLGFKDGLVLEISVRLPEGLKRELMKTVSIHPHLARGFGKG